MTPGQTQDWNPEAYERFRGLRLQPALDLLARVGPVPDGSIVDLGCGAGVMAGALRQRYPDRPLIGIDNSQTMLEKAAPTGEYAELQAADVSDWQPGSPPAMIYSNAALQWLGDHTALMPRLAAMLAPGGVLAVQMPHQNPAASHIGWGTAFQRLFPNKVPQDSPGILPAENYFDLLSDLGELNLWQTEYVQHLAASPEGHPVRHFTQSTYARPYLLSLDQDDQQRLIAAYESDIAQAYPLRSDGTCLMPFRRLFFTLRVA
ncbi:methyltransferase domain-containing protein [uncultured Shimia sp.]|uniref:methyltransferase domain-containing protein n=1 Tax=uncultured Shimia sp. TaxID=573152 RepID=UPI002625F260|nr:methyltransferase domain-containing protein [uncultured Shimia sp.]